MLHQTPVVLQTLAVIQDAVQIQILVVQIHQTVTVEARSRQVITNNAYGKNSIGDNFKKNLL
uniref:Uncharacterized protein n=1 Tax=Meloidogyne enterolobii TaxID=390850 RepID=A0A6V7V024_MELEN|nr:unnamed protein product [Meloidogyne enterolobii]